MKKLLVFAFSFLFTLSSFAQDSPEIWMTYELKAKKGMEEKFEQAAAKKQAKIDNMGSLNKFSDILIWLAKRGFNIHLCVDKRVRNRRENKAVRKFIDKLRRSQTEGRIKLTERNVIDGDGWQRSMHKKTTITPIAVLKGTANMTPSGTGLNEEDVDHIMFGRVQYESTVETTNDVISMSSEII
mgnify:CR=1 FL=1